MSATSGPGSTRTLDLLPEAVLIVSGEGVVTDLNDRARALLGVDADAVGQPLAAVLDLRDDSDATVTDRLAPAHRTVADRLAEHMLRVRLGDGRTRPVAVAGRLRADGGVVLTFRHAGRRERLDALRSDLVATVSHEIRSPLASVKGFTRTMLKKWERFSDAQKRQMLATIDADADRVTRLLTELLDVSRIDAGRVQLDRRMVEVGTLVADIVDRFTYADDGARISLRAGDRLPSVYADADKLEQVLINLVENALRHAPDSPIAVAVTGAGGEVRIAVSDDGPGVPEEQQDRIFEKFSRGRGDRRAGTGLGLYITRGLVEAHGGRVTVESTPEQGATFVVALPAGEPDLPRRR